MICENCRMNLELFDRICDNCGSKVEYFHKMMPDETPQISAIEKRRGENSQACFESIKKKRGKGFNLICIILLSIAVIATGAICWNYSDKNLIDKEIQLKLVDWMQT